MKGYEISPNYAQHDNLSLARHWLMAMPGLVDDLFSRSVIYLCAHDHAGAMGFVMNKVADFSLEHVLKQLNLPIKKPQKLHNEVLLGGPVGMDQGFVVHDGGLEWSGSKRLSGSLVLSPGRDILEAIAADDERLPDSYQVVFGYAGWDDGQLEEEILDNSWHIGDLRPSLESPMDLEHQMIFTLPTDVRWQQTAFSLGLDPARLSWQSGVA